MLSETLNHIQQCRSIIEQLDAFFAFNRECGQRNDTTSPMLLLLYEFEVKARLGDVDLEKVLDKALSQPYAEPKTFEVMAALAVEHSRKDGKRLGIKALKIAVSKYLQMDKADFNKCSKALHSLIEVSFHNGLVSDSSDAKEAWTLCNEVIDIIENRAKNDYPQMETLWLMTKIWNRGIQLYSNGNHSDGIRWCERAMRLLNQMGSIRCNYEDQMTSAYSKLLSGMTTDG